jgi:hypothetical protein
VSTSPRAEVAELSTALHDAGANAKQAATHALETAEKAASHARRRGEKAAAKARARAERAARKAGSRAQKKAAKTAGKAKTRAAASLQEASASLHDASAVATERAQTYAHEIADQAAEVGDRALAAVGAVAERAGKRAHRKAGELSPMKKRSHRVLKTVGVVAAVGGAVALARSLRPKMTARTGSSIPPRVRPVPTPAESAIGGVPDASPSIDAAVAEGADGPSPSDS